MMSAVDVSVLTPSYNQARWLSQNLRSVARQRGVNLEHLVSDGGSTDGSLQILENSTAQWVSEADRGQTHALAKLFQRAEGEVVAWLNSDDAFTNRDVLKTVLRMFRQEPNIALIYGHAAVVQQDDKVSRLLYAPRDARSIILAHNCLSQPAVFMRRSMMPARPFDEAYNMVMDRALWLQMASSGEWRRLNQVLAVDRDHPMRKSFASAAEMRAERAALDGAHGVASGIANRFMNRGRKLTYRAMGTMALNSLAATDDSERAFEWKTPSRRALLFRHLFLPRSMG